MIWAIAFFSLARSSYSDGGLSPEALVLLRFLIKVVTRLATLWSELEIVDFERLPSSLLLQW